ELYYSTKIFKDNNFVRKKCRICGKFFWTLDQNRDTCGDSEHSGYTFFKDKPLEVDYVEFWDRFANFFSKNGHKIIDRYPVVSRWRQDLYFTIASIQDFQRIEKGKMSFEYSANPLIVPQICLRFNDILNVGVTGRHLTSFMMAGQHSFNYPKEGYWRDRTIELNFKFLTDVMKIKADKITYIEDVWAMGDFSEFGPSLESFADGLEIANSVFTQFGFENNQIKELSSKVIDVGWGFERLLYYYTGNQTVFDAVFPKELKYIYKGMSITPDIKLYSKLASMLGKIDFDVESANIKMENELLKKIEEHGVKRDDYYNIIKPMQAAYALADHSMTLLYAMTDGALPSNVGGGYNLRVLLRRMFNFIDKYKINIDIIELMKIEANKLKKLYPELSNNLDTISKVINIERDRYENMKTNAKKIITTMIDKKEQLTKEKMRVLYESYGVTPEFINEVARSIKSKFEVPEEFYNYILKGNFAEKERKKEEINIDVDGIDPTEKLYYKFEDSATATVIKAKDSFVILDRTPFYPEGGGQESDKGEIEGEKVKDVQIVKNVIIHIMENPTHLNKGQKVHCIVDKDRRLRLMVHHTATHLISASARKILGKHAWQEGTHKSASKAHIDIAHYEKFNEEQIRDIENLANSYILNGIKVDVEEMDRGDAESKFGFSIYQGHGVPAKRLRIVTISDYKGNIIDAEACGGLHLKGKENAIGLIKIISTSRPHDGINRIEFVAGPAAFDYINEMENLIKKIALVSGLDKDKLEQGIGAQMNELKKYRKEYRSIIETLSKYIVDELNRSKLENNTLIKELDYERLILREIATKFTELNKASTILLYNRQNEFVCVSGDDSKYNANEFLKEYIEKSKGNFVGGGSKKIAEGKLAAK
ncbi:MAG: alanine--tRNA ligase, partial [Candidatus Micrarchaeia archaeon]